jgi:hypothetical protein
MNNILEIISTIRSSFGGSIAVYTCGNCYQFYEILKSIFPDAKPYYDGNHIWTKINNEFYDIRGKNVIESNLTYVDDLDLIKSLSKNKWSDERRRVYNGESYNFKK